MDYEGPRSWKARSPGEAKCRHGRRDTQDVCVCPREGSGTFGGFPLSVCTYIFSSICSEHIPYRFHPATRRVKEIVDSGELGTITKIEASLAVPHLFIKDGDIRLVYELGGGAMMDMGCEFDLYSLPVILMV